MYLDRQAGNIKQKFQPNNGLFTWFTNVIDLALSVN